MRHAAAGLRPRLVDAAPSVDNVGGRDVDRSVGAASGAYRCPA